MSSYSATDEERYVREDHSSSRSPYARDLARIIHSSAWRRLAAKTQVLSPVSSADSVRNRLTHSLEVSQIGGEIAESLGLDEKIVMAACLAHDIGHPPFGHNGEKALNSWMSGFGGFEGNAQTLRVLARLEPKKFDADGRSVGLNLTRATLDASCKYPWGYSENSDAGNKFGFYEDDSPIFEWFRAGSDGTRLSAEAQVMDFSDDVAYSVHDFEDAIFGGYIDPELLAAPAGHDTLLEKISLWEGETIPLNEIEAAYRRISSLDSWPTTWNGSIKDQARLKDFTSDVIGRFARGAIKATLSSATDAVISRYGADVVTPPEIRAEIAVLKGLVAAFVMENEKRAPVYAREQEVLLELAAFLHHSGPDNLQPQFRAEYEMADSEGAARRIVVDQIASLTDQSAWAWHETLISRSAGGVFT